MTTIESVLDVPPEAWIEALDVDQRETVNALLAQGAPPDQVAVMWLSATGTKDISPFGGAGPNRSLTENFMNEFRSFICGDPKYNEDRKSILGEFKGHHAFLVGSIAACIAPFVGASAPLLAPSVALMLVVLGKVSVNAWCATDPANKDGASN